MPVGGIPDSGVLDARQIVSMVNIGTRRELAMGATSTIRERTFRGALGVFLAFVAYHVGLGSSGTEMFVLAWGALILAVAALATAGLGTAGPLARVGLDTDWSLGFLAARLYVGWEFLYAGWDKATNGWYSGGGEGAVSGTLGGAVAQSHASAADPHPAVSNWFGWTASHLVHHSELLSYLVVTGEIAVGIGLITGLLLRLSAFFGVALNSLFMFAGALGAGLNPEMVLLGMGVLVTSAAGVYALSIDRYMLPRLRPNLRVELLHLHHAPSH
jgi:thiosulfate dehydrogenase [quinone] large subunit